jgi:hypothetical protein
MRCRLYTLQTQRCSYCMWSAEMKMQVYRPSARKFRLNGPQSTDMQLYSPQNTEMVVYGPQGTELQAMWSTEHGVAGYVVHRADAGNMVHRARGCRVCGSMSTNCRLCSPQSGAPRGRLYGPQNTDFWII